MIGGSRLKKRPTLILGTVLLMLAAASAVNVIPSAAEGPPPPIAAEPLTPRSVFPDEIKMKFKLKLHGGRTVVVKVDDPSRTVDVKYTVQPGAQFPWHSHRGPVIVNLISGSLTYVPAGTCHERTYSAGQSFVDPGHGHVHTAFNPGPGVTTFIATFFEAPAEGPLLIPADPACG
jgi:quercetin dioxygenase-like cupin family protein